jgi:hypothetical protein
MAQTAARIETPTIIAEGRKSTISAPPQPYPVGEYFGRHLCFLTFFSLTSSIPHI